MKAKKYMAGGNVGLEEAMAEETGRTLGKAGGMGSTSEKGTGNSDKKKLPSEDISVFEKIPRANLTDRITDAVKGAGKRLKDNVMGTDEQNEAAQKRMEKAKGKKAGGTIRSSASSRADGCAVRGKTRA